MTRSSKRKLAGMLALTMALGMSATVYAQVGNPTGGGDTTSAGTFEGHVDKDVIEVMLPTVATSSNTFAFTMDPEGLIVATANEKYPNATFSGDTGVYFLSAEDTYTANSATLKVTNTGTVDVDVTLTAQATLDDGITMASDATFEGTAAELYLGLEVNGTVSGGDAVPVTVVNSVSGSDAAASVVAGLKGRAANYEVSVSGNDYAFMKKDSVSDNAWNSFTFGLTGACNKAGDWSGVEKTGTSVKVTWAYAKAVEDNAAKMLTENATDTPADVAPSIPTTATYSGTGALEIAYSLGTGSSKKADAITDVVVEINGESFSKNGSWNYSTEFADMFTIESDKIVLSEEWMGYYDSYGQTSFNMYLVYDENTETGEDATFTAIAVTIAE